MVTSGAVHLTATLRSRDAPLKPRATPRASAGQTHSIAREKRAFITLPRCPKPDGSDSITSIRLHHTCCCDRRPTLPLALVQPLSRCPKPDGSDSIKSIRLHHTCCCDRRPCRSRSFSSSAVFAARNAAAVAATAVASVVAVVSAAANKTMSFCMNFSICNAISLLKSASSCVVAV